MGQIGLPALDKMLKGVAFEVLAFDALAAGTIDGEILEDATQAIGRQFFPGAVFQGVEIFQQRSSMNLRGIMVQGKEFANGGEQLKADGGWLRGRGVKDVEQGEAGLFGPAAAGGVGDGQQGRGQLALAQGESGLGRTEQSEGGLTELAMMVLRPSGNPLTQILRVVRDTRP